MPLPPFRRRCRRLADGCRAALALILFGFHLAADAAPAGPVLEPVTLQLKWHHQFQFAGYYAALEKGYYRDAGFDVQILEAAEGVNPVEQVLRGKADFGVGNSDLLLYRHLGEPVVVLGVLFQHSPLRILARADRVANLHDLIGHKVMLEANSAELLAYLQRERIDPANVQQVPHSVSADEFIRGDVDAFSAYATNETELLQRLGVSYLEFDPQSSGIDFYGDNLFTLAPTLKAHPQRVAAFRAASFKGWAYAMQHPQEMVDLILARWSKGSSREHLLFEAEAMRRLIAPNQVEIGYMNPGRWEHIASVYAEVGMLPRSISLDGFLYDPSERRDLSWLYPYLVGVLLATLVVIGFIFYILLLNRRIRGSERRYRTIYENAPLAIMVWGQDRRISGWNRAAESIFGWSREEVAGRDLLDFLVPEEERKPLLAEIGSALDGAGPSQGQHWNRTKSGELVLCQWVHTALCDERGCMTVVALALDVTVKARAEAELVRARQAAEAANRAKSEFLANMSHEIRTPMNGVVGMTSLLLDTPLDPRQQEYVQTIRHSGEMLMTLINDILDLSKIEAGRLEVVREPFDLHECVKAALALVEPRAAEQRIGLRLQLDPEVPRYILGDRFRLHQVLVNLLGNGVKFTQQGEVLLLVHARQLGERVALELEVRDTGIGIPKERMDRLFQSFSQLDASTTRRFGGTGLGLAISRQLVELMGGTIAAESEGEGKGSCFRVVLEVWVAAGMPEPPALAAVQGVPEGELARRQPLRILVVDDQEMNRQVIRLMLERLGYAPAFAGSGGEAVAACAERRFDLVLMDIQMPEMDGEEAAARIRREAPADHRPWLVALTANALVGDRERYLAAGFDAYLSKPVDPETLLRVLALCPVEPVPAGDGQAVGEEEGPIHLPSLQRRFPDAEPYRALFGDLVGIFRVEAQKRLEQAQAAVDRGDAGAARFHMHSLKGASSTIGARRLATLCEEAEGLALGGNLAAVAAGLPEVGAEYRRVCESLGAIAAARAISATPSG